MFTRGKLALAAVLSLAALPTYPQGRSHWRPNVRKALIGPDDCVVSMKNDGMPRSYPGAKLARKALQHRITKR